MQGYGGSYAPSEFVSASVYLRYVPFQPQNTLSILYLFQVLPLIIPLTYTFLLPPTLAFTSFAANSDEDDTEAGSTSAYVSIPTREDIRPDYDSSISYSSVSTKVSLTPREKWTLVKPLLLKFMLPLCEFSLSVMCLSCLRFCLAPACVFLVSTPCLPRVCTANLYLASKFAYTINQVHTYTNVL